MTFEMAQTTLESFPIQYGEHIVQHVNAVYGSKRREKVDNAMIKEIGKAVSPDVKHTLHGNTKDGYVWFATLECKLGEANVAVLFPWSQDWHHPETRMDRSINVYSDRKIPQEDVLSLLENIAYQFTLAVPPSENN